MKYLLIICFIPILAFAQSDVGHLYTSPSTPLHDSLLFSTDLTKRGVTVWKRLPIRINKVVDTQLMMGLSEAYTPETDVPNGNVAGAKTRNLIIQIPINYDIQAAEYAMLEKYIAELGKAGVYVPPIDPPATVVNTIDNPKTNTVNKYTGAWNDTNVPGHLQGTITWSCTAGNIIEFEFTGSKIEWIAEKKNTHGIAQVVLDNSTSQDVDLYNPTEIKQQIVFAKELTQGTHLIKIFVTGRKNQSATNICVVHDAFRVTTIKP